MTTEADPNDANPYRSPEVPSDAAERPLITASGTFRWRMIPVTLFSFFGGFLVIGGLAFFGTGLWRFSHGQNTPLEFPSSVMIVPGCLFLYAARSLWRGPLRRGLLTTLMAIAVYAAFASLLTYLGLA